MVDYPSLSLASTSYRELRIFQTHSELLSFLVGGPHAHRKCLIHNNNFISETLRLNEPQPNSHQSFGGSVHAAVRPEVDASSARD